MTSSKVPPDSMHWECGRCGHWNPIRAGVCEQCQGVLQNVARAFRLHNVLTTEEKEFYTTTAPAILSELRQIKSILIKGKP